MKKIILAALALVAGVMTNGFAQDGGLKVGFRGGYGASGWQGETMKSVDNLLEFTNGNVKTKMRQGFHGGMYVSIPMGAGFELEPGVQYAQKGMVLEGTVPGNAGEYLNAKATITQKSEYLEVPLLARLYVAGGLNLFAGPQVSLLLNNKINVSAGALGINAYNNDFDWDTGQRQVDLGMAAGVGYQFANGLNVSGSYDMGFTTIDADADYKTYNHGFKGSVGFRF
ncbi:outer membrane beta-barrel protein [Nibribacter ruber]|uniref:Outer membrane beta-barrel protein n=1 Tax=Nibribacter ruber TaxID=2698458 RepID=A0A6P1P456_9BACT|nr:porin family protein [Nibribacter ruber]QHL89108.1 outer membrane beta-barrel protein [Nibribacter ruber]